MDGDVLTVRVLLQNDDYIKALEQEVRQANERADKWERKYIALERKYADVQYVNLELIDKCKLNGISVRSKADFRTWEKSK